MISPADLLGMDTHRPYPVPARPWMMRQTWNELLFLHWPVRPDVLRALVPRPLTVETYEGEAWVGVTPFRMTNVRPRGLPAVPAVPGLGPISVFPELNVRTYVRYRNRPAVYFFSLDAASPVAVRLARRFFYLPYFDAAMAAEREGDTIRYRSVRTHRDAPVARFAARYRPTGPVVEKGPASLEYWLTERYALVTLDPRGRVVLGEIHHPAWPLQPAEAEVEQNTMAEAAGIRLPDVPPLLHYAHRLDMLTWRPVRLG